MELPIFKGHRNNFPVYISKSADPDEMQLYRSALFAKVHVYR